MTEMGFPLQCKDLCHQLRVFFEEQMRVQYHLYV